MAYQVLCRVSCRELIPSLPRGWLPCPLTKVMVTLSFGVLWPRRLDQHVHLGVKKHDVSTCSLGLTFTKIHAVDLSQAAPFMSDVPVVYISISRFGKLQMQTLKAYFRTSRSLGNAMPLLPTKLRRALSSQGRLILKFNAINLSFVWIAAKQGLSDNGSDFSQALTWLHFI